MHGGGDGRLVEVPPRWGIGTPPASPRYVLLVTAGVSMWNMGGGYLAGLLLSHCFQRGWLRA